MTRKITFSTPDKKELTITLQDNQLFFSTGYLEAGPFNKEEATDIKDALEQFLEAMDSTPNS